MFQRFSSKLPHFHFKPAWKPINFFQRNFAKVHFNTTKVDVESGQLRSGTTELRYGVVKYNDVIDDLNNWDNLVSCTFVQRPYVLTQLDRWYVIAESNVKERLPPADEIA